MRISFDLDDTLICYREGTRCEPRPLWYRRLFATREPLRLGAPSLMHALSARGWEVCIYTTSFRSPGSVRRWLLSYGVRVVLVINQATHDRRVRLSTVDHSPSKHPAIFGIDLHVDDSDGVRLEGKRHGFRVVVVAPDDDGWAEKVLAAADAIETALKLALQPTRSPRAVPRISGIIGRPPV